MSEGGFSSIVDPALPDAPALVDPGAAARLLDLPALTPAYLRHKRGRSLLVSYRLEDGGIVTAKAFASPQDARAAAARVAPPARLLAGDRVLVLPFPADLRLKGLVAEKRALRKLVSRALGERVPPRRFRVQVVRYKPERRALFLVRHGQDQRLYIRFLGRSAAARLAARMRELARVERDDARLPVPIFFDSGHSALVEPRLEGSSFETIAGDSDPTHRDQLRRLAHLLVRVHRSRGKVLLRERLSDVLGRADRAARSLASLTPAVADAALELGRALRHRAEYLVEAPRAALHGDLYPAQVLVRPRGLALLDFERSVIGDPARDVGGFAGGLLALGIEGAIPRELASRLADGWVRAYKRRAAAGTLSRKRVAWYIALGLLERALAARRAGGSGKAAGDETDLALAHARSTVPTPGFGSRA